VKSYKQALILRTDFPEATCNLLHTLQVFYHVISNRVNCQIIKSVPKSACIIFLFV
jgi:hypothetical protein